MPVDSVPEKKLSHSGLGIDYLFQVARSWCKYLINFFLTWQKYSHVLLSDPDQISTVWQSMILVKVEPRLFCKGFYAWAMTSAIWLVSCADLCWQAPFWTVNKPYQAQTYFSSLILVTYLSLICAVWHVFHTKESFFDMVREEWG